MSFIQFLLQTAGEAAASSEALPQNGAAGSGFGMLIPLVAIVFIMYFFMIRPQSKKQKETQKMIDALKKGDKVVTIGGIHGTISLTKEKTVIVKVDDNVKIEFNRTAIATVIVDKPVVEDKNAKKSKKEEEAVTSDSGETK
ncbi:MAG: preprotein translocase subunit YajC [Treponema sp.]|nr:preprotein translocase subunit YajC [Treponema sp.]